MRASIDAAGRVVIPKGLRDAIGLLPGPVEVHADGARIVIEALAHDDFVEDDGIWVVPAVGTPITDEVVRGLLEDGRR